MNFIFGQPLGFVKGFLAGKAIIVKVLPVVVVKELISVALSLFLLVTSLSSMVSEN